MYGAIERPIDTRDINLGTAQAPVTVPEEYLPPIWLQPLYQGHTPTCGAHAGAHLKTLQENDASLRSPRYAWIKIKQIDGFPLEDGTDMRSIFKAIQANGICHETLLPDAIALPLADYSSPSAITQAMDDDAQPSVGGAYAFGATDEQSIKRAIYQSGCAILLLKVDEGFWGTDTPTFSTGKWGHFVVADGFAKNYIRVYDSADPNPSYRVKNINTKYLNFVQEIGTQIDLSDRWVRGLTSEIALLRKVVSLLLKLKNLWTIHS